MICHCFLSWILININHNIDQQLKVRFVKNIWKRIECKYILIGCCFFIPVAGQRHHIFYPFSSTLLINNKNDLFLQILKATDTQTVYPGKTN